MSSWSSIERLAGRQHGVVARWQVIALGIPARTFSGFVDRHGWVSLSNGVWAAPWSRPSSARRCTVARISGPRGRVLTGGAVLTLGGVRRLEPSRIDLLVAPRLSVARRPSVYVYRGGWVAGDRLMRLHGIPAAPWFRAVTDAASRSSVDRLTRDLAALDRTRRGTPAEVAAYLARWHLRAAGFSIHPRPLMVTVRERRLGEIDIAMCAIRYGMEVDGPSHRLDGAAQADEVRDRRLRRVDWRIDRFTDEQVRTDPGAVVQADRRVLLLGGCAPRWFPRVVSSSAAAGWW
jgi:hypothetical protein